MTAEKLEFHPYANLFPMIQGREFVELKADIQVNGVREPVYLLEGKILDGRNRYTAALEVGADVRFENYEGDDALAFVISLNLHRRHLSESQRSMVAAKLANMPAHRPDTNTANLHTSRADAASMLNVSERSVNTAKMVEAKAPAEVVKAVEQGSISVSLAAKVTELPEETRMEIAATPPEQMKEAAREAVHNHRAQGTGENEWYTPDHYIESARGVMGGIDLDPATSALAQEVVKAAQIFTIDDDGLQQKWAGRVWLNPPYAQPAIHNFMEKITAEVVAGNVDQAIVLTHNYTDTRWFHIAVSKASAICFTRGRIGFLSPEGKKAAPTQGQAFFYFGESTEAFADEFCQYGFVAQIVTPQIEKVAA